MQEQIRRFCFPGSRSDSETNTRIDKLLCKDKRHLIVFVANLALAGEIPDERLLHDIEKVQNQYGTLTFVVHIGKEMPAAALPEGLVPVVPPVNTDAEFAHYYAERDAYELIEKKYGRATP